MLFLERKGVFLVHVWLVLVPFWSFFSAFWAFSGQFSVPFVLFCVTFIHTHLLFIFAHTRSAETSPEYRQFLSFLGETIPLRDWRGYRGGLDVVNGLTGTTSVYTKWQGYEIMMHVGTMLPLNEQEVIQLERKRHIGNDILVIIFQDSDEVPVQLDSVDSKQNHVFAVVSPHGDGYKFALARKQGVPEFSPPLPAPCYLTRDTVARDFFLHKRTPLSI